MSIEEISDKLNGVMEEKNELKEKLNILSKNYKRIKNKMDYEKKKHDEYKTKYYTSKTNEKQKDKDMSKLNTAMQELIDFIEEMKVKLEIERDEHKQKINLL
eukprot:488096_1